MNFPTLGNNLIDERRTREPNSEYLFVHLVDILYTYIYIYIYIYINTIYNIMCRSIGCGGRILMYTGNVELVIF
jgi:hypothetical protein